MHVLDLHALVIEVDVAVDVNITASWASSCACIMRAATLCAVSHGSLALTKGASIDLIVAIIGIFCNLLVTTSTRVAMSHAGISSPTRICPRLSSCHHEQH